MNTSLSVTLNLSPEQTERLQGLQTAFALVCNELAPLVQQDRCWNRVTLHHLAYKSLRQKFPALGSQMICNAIYSVSRTARIVFQHPASPFHHSKLAGKSLPLLRFSDSSPVYFDRHTLSLKEGVLSMYTLDGRMRFRLGLSSAAESSFHEKKLREILLSRKADGLFELSFWFTEAPDADVPDQESIVHESAPGKIPEYVIVEEAA
jgi:hypothetical protein